MNVKLFEAQMKWKWKTKLENIKSFHWIVNVGVIIRTSFEHSFPYPCGILNVYWICTTDMTPWNPNTKTSIYTTSTITVLLSESATFEACRALLPSSLHASSNAPTLMYLNFQYPAHVWISNALEPSFRIRFKGYFRKQPSQI